MGSWKTDEVVNRYFVVFVVIIQESCLIDREAAAVDNSVSVSCNLNCEKLELRLASSIMSSFGMELERAEMVGPEYSSHFECSCYLGFILRTESKRDRRFRRKFAIDRSILLIREWKSGPEWAKESEKISTSSTFNRHYNAL